MKRLLLFMSITVMFLGCVDEAFQDGGISNIPQEPTGLKYASVVEARELGVVISAPPTYNSFGAIPFFEIVGVRNESGASIDQNVIDQYFSILNATEETINIVQNGTNQPYTVNNVDDIGRIKIETNNPLEEGTYYFDIKMTSTFDNQTFEAVFQDVFELYMGPALASGLLYIPGGQNLLTDGVTNVTTEPIVFGANPDFRFELGDNQDKFSINATTGVITLNSGYSPVSEPEIISPTINLVSNISEEVVSFNEAIKIYISNNPVDIPKQVVNVFYPTFEFESTAYGFRTHDVVDESGASWARLSPPSSSLAEDRPVENSNQKRLELNLVKPAVNNQLPRDSWVIMNSQDLTAYQYGFDVEAKFLSMNKYVEYLSTDSSTPSDLEVYVSTDYLGDFDTATWTEVTDVLESNIVSSGAFIQGNEFVGYPYPGDQKDHGIHDSDGLKDSSKNADGKWVESTLNLVDYLGMSNVTVAIRIHTTFQGSLAFSSSFGRAGRFLISDFNITAYEQ